jgi:release factor glutamine methyltransferase
MSAVDLIAHPEGILTAQQQRHFLNLVKRRAVGEPIAYLIGQREFFGIEFNVSPAVLIPRPETELLVELALGRIHAESACRVLDLGTGSGCVGIAVAKHRPAARVVGVDKCSAALMVARDNATRNQVTNFEVSLGDWFSGLDGRVFDVVVANPPYIAAGDRHLNEGDLRFEPPTSLISGDDGLDDIRAIIAAAPNYLVRGALLAIEHGYDQAETCENLLVTRGFTHVRSHHDLAGIARVTSGVWGHVSTDR